MNPIRTLDLPQWRCHKVVGAFKIGGIELSTRKGMIQVYEVSDAPREQVPYAVVPREAFRARTPDNSRPLGFPDEYVGGYLVQYEDGYLSWSPAEAFEKGYTRIE